MFSTTSSRGKWVWALVDLLVVIIGVYIAFLIQSYSEENTDKREKIKVYSALKMELEMFRVSFPLFAEGNLKYLKKNSAGDLDISAWRFVEPQYGYQIIEYSINIQNTEIINFETYDELKKLYVAIKRLEHTERLITEVASEYQYPIPELEAHHDLNLERKANNKSRVMRFRMFLRGRIGMLKRISESLDFLLNHVNEKLGPVLSKEINKRFIVEQIGWMADSEKNAIEIITKHFSEFTEEEALKVYREAIQKESDTAPN